MREPISSLTKDRLQMRAMIIDHPASGGNPTVHCSKKILCGTEYAIKESIPNVVVNHCPQNKMFLQQRQIGRSLFDAL
jgi:hypothetical protein